MKVSAEKLLQTRSGALYLYGEDRDTISEVAEALLAENADATRMRVDISELGQIEVERSNQGLFGPSLCHALVRNAESANVKQSEHLLALIRNVKEGDKLIVCAAEVSWKKALHKTLQAEKGLIQCEFRSPSPAEFRVWFAGVLQEQHLQLDKAALEMVVDHLCGLRAAARQFLERLRLYDNGQGEVITLDVVGDLLGERAPEALEAWCHAVAAREHGSLELLHRLLREQHVSEVQLVSWLGIRLQQLLMYRWYSEKGVRNPLQAAKVFGDARKSIPSEAKQWKIPELRYALSYIVDAEKLVKGASIEDKAVVMEQLTLKLLANG